MKNKKEPINEYIAAKYEKSRKEKTVIKTVNLFESDVKYMKDHGLNRSRLVRDLLRDFINKAKAS